MNQAYPQTATTALTAVMIPSSVQSGANPSFTTRPKLSTINAMGLHRMIPAAHPGTRALGYTIGVK